MIIFCSIVGIAFTLIAVILIAVILTCAVKMIVESW